MNTSNTKNVCTIIILSLTFLSVTSAKIIYVDDDANGLNDGSSWTNAYNYLQDALSDANSSAKPVEICVAQGIYKPDQGSGKTPGDREDTFQLINGVTLRGGYAGFGEPDPNARDVDLYETILSGDLNDNDVDVNEPWELWEEPTRSENSYNIVTGSGTDETTVIDGFTITGGNANDASWVRWSSGGGMYNHQGCPMVSNCILSRNSAMVGGGMWNVEGGPLLTKCRFTGNYASGGGGLYNQSNPTLVKCTFTENSAITGGGMNDNGGNPMLTNCTFRGNSAWAGGGIWLMGTCCPVGVQTVTNCIFSGNSATYGGAVHSSYDDLILANCIFTENSAECYGGGMYNASSSPTVTNCILWADVPSEIHGDPPIVTYSDVQGSWEGQGNINTDPCFADANNQDYHLKSQAGRWDANEGRWTKDEVTSLCIDAGDPASPIGLEPFPNGGIINMGAYGGTAEASKSYFGKPPCETIIAGDINGDCKVDFKDFAFMAYHWLEEH